MSEEILSSAAYREVYGGNPVFRDRNGKPWFLNDGKPTALANGQEPQKEYFDVKKVEEPEGQILYLLNGVWLNPIYVNSNTPIPNTPPDEFKGWFVDEQNRVVPPAVNTGVETPKQIDERLLSRINDTLNNSRRDQFALAIYCALRPQYGTGLSATLVRESTEEADALIAELDKERT